MVQYLLRMFVEVFEIIALAYAEYNPEDKEQIIHLIPRLEQAYGI